MKKILFLIFALALSACDVNISAPINIPENTPAQTTAVAPLIPTSAETTQAATTQTPSVAATPVSEQPAQPQAESPAILAPNNISNGHVLFVSFVQDRPNEVPDLPGRPDFYAELYPFDTAELLVPAQGSRYIAVEAAFVNSLPQPWRPNPQYLRLRDQNGTEYEPMIGAVNMNFAIVDIFNGLKTRGWVAFEIPETSTPDQLIYRAPEGETLVSGLNPNTADMPPYIPDAALQTSAGGYGYGLASFALFDPSIPDSSFVYTYMNGYRPVSVEIDLSNTTSSAFRMNTNQFMLVDEQGYVYYPVSGGTLNFINTDDLQPGETRRGEVSFDVPRGVRPVQLIFLAEPFTQFMLSVRVQ